MTIYVVFGTTGEYSDRSLWPVRAFRTEAQARELIELASAAAREFYQKYEDDCMIKYELTTEEWKKINPYDPKFEMDYTGTTYYIEKVELDE